MDAGQIATYSARAMWARDDASKWLGLTLDEVAPGYARMSLTVAKHHTQGHDMCHGGYIFTLADSAFAFACNSYNEITVAQHNTISFLASAWEGDVLTAEAREVFRRGRSGLYDVRVTNQKGEAVAEMRGASRTIKGRHFDPDKPEERT
ncbi:MAG: hydroxyphenylacetyl-CoA thioesterase PaaI [Pikeienuella sp.]|uniref:hydroxyphenylacetyl-CoA thioesterase PaaI n=1 Tax=Pikeienuella sp. TaxID=2831957 RepID=UPI003919B751